MNKPTIRLGAPLKWSTPEELKSEIEEYLNNTPIAEWTVTGLALSMGTYRSGVDNYENKPVYKEIINDAKKLIEHSYEIDVKTKGHAGVIFGLKNFGWKDKTEVDTTNRITVINEVVKSDIIKEDNGLNT